MTTPEGKEMEFIVEPVVTAKGVANCAKVNQLDASQGSNVSVVNKCHTPFRERGNEASIRVPRMFKSHAWQQYDKQMQCY
jgi:hypothetical protein